MIDDNLIGLVAVVMGCSMVLIPILGFTARYALKPTMEAIEQFMRSKGTDDALRIQERRLDLMEQQLEQVEHRVRDLLRAQKFDRQLRGRGAEALPADTEPRGLDADPPD